MLWLITLLPGTALLPDISTFRSCPRPTSCLHPTATARALLPGHNTPPPHPPSPSSPLPVPRWLGLGTRTWNPGTTCAPRRLSSAALADSVRLSRRSMRALRRAISFWEEETTARLITPPLSLPQSKSTGTGRLNAGHAQRTLFPGPGSEPLTPSQGLCCLWEPDRNLERRTHHSPVGLAVLALLGKTEARSLFLYSLILVPHSFAGVCSCLTHLLHEALPGYL